MTKRLFVLSLVLMALLITIAGNVSAQGPTAQHSGEITLTGLVDRVEILRDVWGVPQIYANNWHDLFYAQGYTQAQDRWWQMEWFRHIGSGTLQELTGQTDSLMGTDLFLRTLDLRGVAERELAEAYNADEVALLQAFADGVNAYLEGKEPTDLAFQYAALRLNGVTVEIEPWTPVDSLVWGKIMAYNLGSNYDIERLLSQVYDTLSEDMVDDWFPAWPYGEKPTIVWPEDIAGIAESAASAAQPTIGAGITGIHTQMAGNFTQDDLARVGLDTGPAIGSNNWVVGGSMTESGAPLMANDMHLGIQMPSIWYEIGLHCQPVSEDCPYNVSGFALSPSPAVVAGHNDHISWAFTNVGPDTQDLYEIHVNPDNPLQYEWDGEWRDMTVRDETFNFGDGAVPVTIQVRVTHLGPIVNDNQRDDDGNLLGFNNEDPLALRWTSLDPGTLYRGVLALNQAQNYDEFREALRSWDSPSQNVIFADVDGNIGYQTPGLIPVRAPGHTGILPVPGWTSDYEWLGFIPFDYLPHIYNPARGYIASANQALVPLEYYDMLASELGDQFGADANYVISHEWDYGYRGARINQLLEELAPHNAATFQQIHGDNFNGNAAEIVPLLADLQIDDPDLADTRDWLLQWDFEMNMDSQQAPLYANFWVRLMDNLYNDQLGDEITANGNQNEWRGTYLLMSEPDNVWWDDAATADVVETRDEIVIRSLQEGYDATVTSLGEDRSTWTWGALHTVTFVSDPLGQSGIAAVENIVNRGPFPVAGSSVAVNAVSWDADSFEAESGPSERVIYDLSNWDNSLSIHPTGESGLPTSDNYDDMIDLWRLIEYKPMVWSREAVEAAATNTLVLLPSE